MKTILVPTDLSPLADSALKVAADLARTYGAEILLVHYIPFSIAVASTAEGSLMLGSYLEEQDANAVSDLQQIITNPAYQDVSITPISCRDAGGLYEAMTERQCDLIVLTTHGASGWNEWLFGSNAEHITRFAHCPVLVLKKAVVPFAPTTVIASIDVDTTLKQHWPAYPFTAGGNRLSQFVYVSTPSDNCVPEGVHAWMHELAQEKKIGEYTLHIQHARSAEEGILRYAHERQADLLVLFTHGHTGLRHLLQGSVAEDVLNHASIPVLILHINR
ncbi:universal stress protein [Spirosoma flavum]|uniref:Universal stress protein n=1 Tax=Spirosoma flavum TaxID=2048557 RepID=A0ABW6AKK9_9BACT